MFRLWKIRVSVSYSVSLREDPAVAVSVYFRPLQASLE